jgi:hypothetical protein
MNETGRVRAFDLVLSSGLIAIDDLCRPRRGLHLVCARWWDCAGRRLHAHRARAARDLRWLWDRGGEGLLPSLPRRHRRPLSLATALLIANVKRRIDPGSSPEYGWKAHHVHSRLDQWARETVRALARSLSVPHVRATSWERRVEKHEDLDLSAPFMIRGFAADWPAVARWDPSRASFDPLCGENNTTNAADVFACRFRCGDEVDERGSGTDNGEVTISLSDLFEYCTVSHNRTTIRFTCSTASLPTTAGAQACWTITIAVPIVAPTVFAQRSTPVISWPECRRSGPRIAGFLSARADLGRRCTEIRRAPLRGTRC